MSVSSTSGSSAIDVNSIVSQLMVLEQRPLTALQRSEATVQSQISSFATLQGASAALQAAATALASPTTYSGLKANVTGGDFNAAVNGSTSAAPGQYSVEVQALAAGQSIASIPFSSSATGFASGTLTILDGTWDATHTNFTSSGPGLNLTIDASNNTLGGIRDAINSANGAVTASLVTDSTGTRITIQSKATGASSGFLIKSNEDGAVIGTSLFKLNYSPSVGDPSSPTQLTRSAADSKVVINGLTLTSATNQYSSAIDGVTLNLTKAELGVTNSLTISNDTSSTRAVVDSFVKAYNDFNSTIKSLSAYDPASNSAGILTGDATVRSLQFQVGNIVRGNVIPSVSGDFSNLSSLGIEVQKDGTLKINETTYATAAADPAKIGRFFSSTGVGNARGLGARLKALTDSAVGTSGLLPSRTAGLQAQAKALSSKEYTISSGLTLTQNRLRAQYSALDAQLQAIQSTSDSLTSALAQLQSTIVSK